MSDTLTKEELLTRIRASIGSIPSGTIASITIDVEETEESTHFRFTITPEDSITLLSAGHSIASQCTLPTERSTEALSNDTEVHAEESTTQEQAEDEMEEDKKLEEGDGVLDGMDTNPTTGDTTSSPVICEDGNTSPSMLVSLQSGENIRRSARKHPPIDRLVYAPPTPRRSTDSSRETSRAVHKRRRGGGRVDTADSTDDQSDSSEESDAASLSSTTSSSSTQQSSLKQRKKCHYQNTVEDCDKEDQVAALVMQFEEAYANRNDTNLEWTSREAVLNLGRDVLGNLLSVVPIDSASYQQCANKLDHLIATSAATRMLGYYLKGALAAKLKQSHRNQYTRTARTLLQLKSSADITACPAFYEFVQQHCSTTTTGGGMIDIEALLREPIFLADIGWSEWRRYLGKQHCWMICAAIKQFKASLEPVEDWMQRGWVEEYLDDRLGKGVRAKCDIPLPSIKERRQPCGNAVVADLNIFVQAQKLIALDGLQQPQTDDDWISSSSSLASCYRFEWNRGKQVLNAEKLWVGRINHLPGKHCNLRLSSNGKLMQAKSIKAGEALTFDYTMQYWVERVTGITWKQWIAAGAVKSRKGSADLFERMHRTVLDYTSLLSQHWNERFAKAKTELDKEMVMMDLWHELVPEAERRKEEEV